MRTTLTLVLLFAIVGPAFADNFRRVEQRQSFISVIKDNDLTQFGIRLKVTGDGEILGRAFGRNVSGVWSWQNGYFCRNLFVGGSQLDSNNCQLVEVKGDTVRFTSDKGAGDSADLRLR